MIKRFIKLVKQFDTPDYECPPLGCGGVMIYTIC